MYCFAPVRATGYRDFLRRGVVATATATLNQRNCLQRFDRGPWVDGALDVADREDDATFPVDDSDFAAMAALENAAARHLDQNGVALVRHSAVQSSNSVR